MSITCVPVFTVLTFVAVFQRDIHAVLYSILTVLCDSCQQKLLHVFISGLSYEINPKIWPWRYNTHNSQRSNYFSIMKCVQINIYMKFRESCLGIVIVYDCVAGRLEAHPERRHWPGPRVCGAAATTWTPATSVPWTAASPCQGPSSVSWSRSSEMSALPVPWSATATRPSTAVLDLVLELFQLTSAQRPIRPCQC